MEKAVFLDKDGTVIEDIPYNVDPRKVTFLPSAWEGLKLLHGAGFRLVIVTNQSGVARGLFSEDDLLRLSAYFRRQFGLRGITLSGFYYCPHLPRGVIREYAITCACRKPRPGLILRAAGELRLDLSRSWCVGNIPTDVECGNSAGCRTVLLDRGSSPLPPARPGQTPDIVAGDLLEAGRAMLGMEADR